MKGQEAFLLFKKGHLVFKKPDDLFPCNKISYAYSLLFAPPSFTLRFPSYVLRLNFFLHVLLLIVQSHF